MMRRLRGQSFSEWIDYNIDAAVRRKAWDEVIALIRRKALPNCGDVIREDQG